MAWLKTPNGTLVNLDQIAAFKMVKDYGSVPEVGVIIGGQTVRVGGDEDFLDALEEILDLYVIEDHRAGTDER